MSIANRSHLKSSCMQSHGLEFEPKMELVLIIKSSPQKPILGNVPLNLIHYVTQRDSYAYDI